jgi:hypothetical protein
MEKRGVDRREENRRGNGTGCGVVKQLKLPSMRI